MQNGLKQGQALLPLFSNLALEDTIQRSPGKPSWTEIEWDTSSVGLC
jgi:hypothetical protein